MTRESKPVRNAPKEPGFYWALWMTASRKTHEGDELTPAAEWDVVEVWQNHVGPEDDETFGVSVPGVREAQWLENFIWGPGVQRPDLARYR